MKYRKRSTIEGVADGRIEGRNEGRLEIQKETAITLAERGMSISEIAEIIKVSDRVVEGWLSEGSDPAK